MSKIIQYQHRGIMVSVDEDLKGKHRDNCLCFRCEKFHPEPRDANCPMSNLLFAVDVQCGLTTPVYECSHFVEVKGTVGPVGLENRPLNPDLGRKA